jgi:hypothetical protein
MAIIGYLFYLLTFNIISHNYCYWRMYFWQLILYPLAVNIWLFVAFHCQKMSVLLQSSHRWPRAIKFNPHHLVLWSFLGLSQWVYVRDDMSKGLKIMSLGVINHSMSFSVQTNFEKTMFEYKCKVSCDVYWLNIWINKNKNIW